MTIQDLAERVEHASRTAETSNGTLLPGVFIYRASKPTQIEAITYEPIVCLIVQGEKQTTVGDQTVSLEPGQCVVVGHDLPVLARISKASVRTPFLSLIIHLDLELLRSLDDALEEFDSDAGDLRSLEVAPVTDQLVDVLLRTIALLDHPVDARVLFPLVHKELHFRLLRSESGAMLRALANRDSHASSIARAIRTLREQFRAKLDVAELAKSVGMSTSSFHRHFKGMTRTTPLQYLKDLRLAEARRLLRAGGSSVSTAAFEVGYESPSQFSREYSRRFGAAPRADLRVA